MIKEISEVEELKKEIGALNSSVDVEAVLKIDLPFIDSQKDFTIINIPSYISENKCNFIFTSKSTTLIYSPLKTNVAEKKFAKTRKNKNGESTVAILLNLKAVLKNYSYEFIKIRETMNSLDVDPVLDSIENVGRDLRKLTDRMEGLMQIAIELKEEEIECFDVTLINFDYEILTAEIRYWLERCRSHVYRIASLRTKSEMKSNKELNDTMKKLTVIMTFLTIASIVVNVPGTVGAIFGIPALSDAYFREHVGFLVATLISTTLLSIILGFLYWKSLGLTSR